MLNLNISVTRTSVPCCLVSTSVSTIGSARWLCLAPRQCQEVRLIIKIVPESLVTECDIPRYCFHEEYDKNTVKGDISSRDLVKLCRIDLIYGERRTLSQILPDIATKPTPLFSYVLEAE